MRCPLSCLPPGALRWGGRACRLSGLGCLPSAAARGARRADRVATCASLRPWPHGCPAAGPAVAVPCHKILVRAAQLPARMPTRLGSPGCCRWWLCSRTHVGTLPVAWAAAGRRARWLGASARVASGGAVELPPRPAGGSNSTCAPTMQPDQLASHLAQAADCGGGCLAAPAESGGGGPCTGCCSHLALLRRALAWVANGILRQCPWAGCHLRRLQGPGFYPNAHSCRPPCCCLPRGYRR